MPSNTQVLGNAGPYLVPETMTERQRSVTRAIKLLLEADGVSPLHRRQLVDIALWKFTEASGMTPHPKYNLRYVSDGARDVSHPVSVNHEHVWSRKWLLDKLFARGHWDEAELGAFLERHAVACVVSVEEHALLGNVPASGWKRYLTAGVAVWDRLTETYLDLASDEPLAASRSATPVAKPAAAYDVQELILEEAGAKAGLLQRLTRMARFANAVAVVSVTQQGQPSRYFRIHDTLLDEPTAAVAYVHWNGSVHYALQMDEVPAFWREEGCVNALQQPKYAVSAMIDGDDSLEIAEELLFLALQKVRSAEE